MYVEYYCLLSDVQLILLFLDACNVLYIYDPIHHLYYDIELSLKDSN